MKIGLTGGIASGKNFVASLFEKLGCYTLDADEASRAVMRPDGAAYPQVVAAFGESILSNSGEIDRSALRELVVADNAALKALEKIVHPAVAAYSDKFYRSIKGKDDKAIFIHHAPLLIEAGGIERYDAIILIYCPEETQLERLKARGYPPYSDGVKLMHAQMSYEDKLKHAHHVIDNSGTMEQTKAEVERVHALLQMLKKK
jgi:dephospho-CoA kinase